MPFHLIPVAATRGASFDLDTYATTREVVLYEVVWDHGRPTRHLMRIHRLPLTSPPSPSPPTLTGRTA